MKKFKLSVPDLTFSNVGVVVMLITSSFYIVRLIDGGAIGKTSLTSWLLWSFISIANAFNYHKVAGKDFAKSKIYFFNAIAFSAQFDPLKIYDYVVIVLVVIAMIIWAFNSANAAQVILLLAISMAFVPLWTKMKLHIISESPILWSGWGVAMVLALLQVIKDWNISPTEVPREEWRSGQWVTILGPVTYVWFHIITVILAL